MASGRRVSHELHWGEAEYQESCLMDRIQVSMTVPSPCTRDLPALTDLTPRALLLQVLELSRMSLSRGVTHCDALNLILHVDENLQALLQKI